MGPSPPGWDGPVCLGLEGQWPVEALVFLGFAGLLPGQSIVNVGPKAGPQNEACHQDDDQQDHKGVRACVFPQPEGHAEGGGPKEQERSAAHSTAGPWFPARLCQGPDVQSGAWAGSSVQPGVSEAHAHS